MSGVQPIGAAGGGAMSAASSMSPTAGGSASGAAASVDAAGVEGDLGASSTENSSSSSASVQTQPSPLADLIMAFVLAMLLDQDDQGDKNNNLSELLMGLAALAAINQASGGGEFQASASTTNVNNAYSATQATAQSSFNATA